MKIAERYFVKLLAIVVIMTVMWGCDIRSTDDDSIDNMQGELSLEAVTDSEVRISWQSNSDVKDYYLIERSEGDGAYSEIAEVNTDQTVYRDTALTVGVYYRYRLSGFNGDKQTNFIENSVELDFLPVTEFLASGTGVHYVNLTWIHDCTYEEGYILERKDAGDLEFETIAVIPPDSFSYTDSLAYPGVSLNYRVTAFTQYNQSNSMDSYVMLSFPSPEEFSVVQLDVNQFSLSWEDLVNGEDNYIIERRIDAGQNQQIAVLEPNTVEYLDDISIREPINSITWWIKAVYQDYESNTESVTLDVVFTAPHIELIEHETLTSCRVFWEDNSIGETGFRIDRRIDGLSWVEGYAQVEANTTEWVDEDIIIQEGYYYRILAFSSNNISEASNSYYYLGSFPAPDGLVYEIVTFGEINLEWNDNSNGEDGFMLDRRLLGESWEVPYQEFPADTESFTDTGLETGSQVSYRISAFSGEFQSAYDQLFFIDVIVDPPGGLGSFLENIHTISLYWIDNIDGEDGYKIDREVNGTWTNEFFITDPNAENYTDYNVPVNSSVRYRVYVYSGDFNGEQGLTDMQDTTIDAPTGLYHILDGLNSLTLHWSDVISGENGFIIDRYTEDGGWQQQYGSTSANSETWTDTDLTYGSILKYRVYAYYGEENGDFAETDEIIVELPAPQDLQWERTGLTAVELSWEDVITGEDNYVIDRRIDGGEWNIEYALLPAQTIVWQDNDLELGSEIEYRVYGRVEENDGASAETGEIMLDFPEPEDFSVEFNAPDQLEFSWSYQVDGIDGFFIESYDYNQGWQMFADNIPPENESWNATGEEWGIYRVTAFLGTELEAPSDGAGVAPEGFVAVAGGTFQMGDQFFEGDDDELPLHDVELSGFYIGVTEVTQAQYTDIMGSNPSSNQGTSLPVEDLEWYDAVEYCNELSIAEGYDPCYTINGDDVSCDWSADGYRLLTEAEWEYAARGGIHWEDNYRYSGSSTLALVGWNNGTYSQACATKAANQLGIYDMSGNVWEMCWDMYDDNYYSSSELTDPTGVTDGFSRVNRGGGYNSSDDNCRVANRYHRDETYNDGNLGFRICRRK